MTWRCPHCGTPQPEAARCWVCRRSSTCCGTCRYFSRAVVAGAGFCLLDRRRRVRRGDELEPCWTARPSAHGPGWAVEPSTSPRTSAPSGRTFVPILSVPSDGEVEGGPRLDGVEALGDAGARPEDELDLGFWSALEGRSPA